MKNIIQTAFVISFFLASTAFAGAYSVANSSGVSISGNLGYQGSVVGGSIAYYHRIDDTWSIAPYAGGGQFPDENNPTIGFNVGLMASVGLNHRAILDINYGLSALQSSLLSNTAAAIYGVTAAAGYEFLADGGFLARATGGYTLYTTETIKTGDPTLNLSLGWKFF